MLLIPQNIKSINMEHANQFRRTFPTFKRIPLRHFYENY